MKHLVALLVNKEGFKKVMKLPEFRTRIFIPRVTNNSRLTSVYPNIETIQQIEFYFEKELKSGIMLYREF